MRGKDKLYIDLKYCEILKYALTTIEDDTVEWRYYRKIYSNVH